METIDVTDLVEFENPDDEALPITKCVCGEKFDTWHFIIGVYFEKDWVNSCSKCGAKLYFRNSVRVYQIKE